MHDRISPDANFRYPLLARRLQKPHREFSSRQRHIDATRPDLVVNSGDVSFDGPTNRRRSGIRQRTARRRCRCLAATCPAITTSATTRRPSAPRQRSCNRKGSCRPIIAVFGEDRWQFEAAGWCFIGLNSLIMNTGIESEAEQFDWLASQLAGVNGRPVALFLHKPLFLNAPDDPETSETAIRYVPQPRRSSLIEMFGGGRSAAGRVRPRPSAPRLHLWPYPPCLGAVCRLHHSRKDAASNRQQGVRAGGISFAPDSFEVRHVRAPGQIDVGLDSLIGRK